MLTAVAAIALTFSNQAAGESNQRRIILPVSNKIEALSPKEAADKCALTLDQNAKLGGLDLLVGSGACAKASRPVEASFLFNVGVIRGAADVSLLIPATKADSQSQYDLTVSLYYSAGNVGSDEVIRKRDDRNRLVTLIERWKPYYSQDYRPGWAVEAYPSPEEYNQLVAEAKKDTIGEINRVAVLVTDDEYYRLHTEYVALIQRVGRQEKQDPSDIAKIEALQAAKMRRAAALGDASALSASSTKQPSTLEQDSRYQPEPALPKAARIIDRPNDPVVKKCTLAAKRHAVSDGGVLLRAVVVEETEFGVVYRADLSADTGGETRFWCSDRFTGSQPLGSGLPDYDVAPLPDKPR